MNKVEDPDNPPIPFPLPLGPHGVPLLRRRLNSPLTYKHCITAALLSVSEIKRDLQHVGHPSRYCVAWTSALLEVYGVSILLLVVKWWNIDGAVTTQA